MWYRFCVKRDKRLGALRRSFRSVSLSELDQVLRDHGFELVHVLGSHHVYRHAALRQNLSIPSRKPVLPVYVRRALDAIDQVIGQGEQR